MVSLSGLRARALQVGTMSLSSVMYADIYTDVQLIKQFVEVVQVQGYLKKCTKTSWTYSMHEKSWEFMYANVMGKIFHFIPHVRTVFKPTVYP